MQTQDPTALLLVAVVFAGVIGFVVYSAIKRREEAFEGAVIDKDIIETQMTNNNPAMNQGMNRPTIVIGNTGGVRHTYSIKVKTDQGKEISYTISAGMYETIKIGDRVSKPKGTTEITIVSSAASTPATSPDQSPPTIPPPSQGPNPPESTV